MVSGFSENQGSSTGDPDSVVSHAALGVCQHTLRCESSICNRTSLPFVDRIPVVDSNGRALAIHRRDALPLP